MSRKLFRVTTKGLTDRGHYVVAAEAGAAYQLVRSFLDAKDWGFVEYEGAGPWRWVQGRDAFETSYSAYLNMVALQRNAIGSWTSFTDSTFFSHVV